MLPSLLMYDQTIPLFQILLLDKYTLSVPQNLIIKVISTCFLESSISCSILEMSSLFVLLDYSIIILISALYNPSHCLFVRANRGSCLCLIWLYKIALKLMHYVVASLHLKALDYFNFFLVFLLMLYMQKTGLCVSCYLAVILALYMHQLCVTGPFKYRCYDKN